MHLKIGTRASKLALAQTAKVIGAITEKFPKITCEIIPITTTGDRITDRNLYDIGGKALFLKEIEERLLAGEIHMAVHSLKDVPGRLPENLKLAAFLEREDARDCFISFTGLKSITELPEGATLGSSSMRRKAIIFASRPDIKTITFRGNVPTRLEKLRLKQADATILAVAGLKRLGLYDPSYCTPIDTEIMCPAAGQGTVTVEINEHDSFAAEICAAINHMPTHYLALAERGFLTYLNASCDTPLAAHAVYLPSGEIKAQYMLACPLAFPPLSAAPLVSAPLPAAPLPVTPLFDSPDLLRYHIETCTTDEVELIGVRAARLLSSPPRSSQLHSPASQPRTPVSEPRPPVSFPRRRESTKSEKGET